MVLFVHELLRKHQQFIIGTLMERFLLRISSMFVAMALERSRDVICLISVCFHDAKCFLLLI